MWRRGEGKEGSKAEVDGQCKCGLQGEESVGGGGVAQHLAVWWQLVRNIDPHTEVVKYAAAEVRR